MRGEVKYELGVCDMVWFGISEVPLITDVNASKSGTWGGTRCPV